MSIDTDYFKKVYFEECAELMETGENILINLSKLNILSDNQEDINSLFRCIHSIKGGGGTFGYNHLIEFAHQYETLLDHLRDGRVSLSKENINVLLKAHDVLEDLIEDAENIGSDLPPEYDNVLELIAIAYGSQRTSTNKKPSSEQPNNTSINSDKVLNSDKLKILRFVPHPSIMHFGNDPLLIIRELERIIYKNLNAQPEENDSLVTVRVNTERVPPLENLTHRDCYLEWDIIYPGSIPDDVILDVFEFVDNDCNLFISDFGEEKEVQEKVSQKSEKVDSNNTQAREIQSPLKNDLSPKKTDTKDKEVAIQSIRVDLDRIDKLVNTVGEMVIKHAMVIDQANAMGSLGDESNKTYHDELVKGLHDLTQHTRDLQESVMSIRAQPVKTVFSRLPRLVREVSNEIHKEVRFETLGENTEIDKTVIERLGEPLTHLVRNAVDHGIESPEEREAQGKSREGLLTVSAGHRSGRIVIEIKDDGKGIDREKVLKKAQEKNLIDPDTTLSDEEIDQLIFLPGFSTAVSVSNISGRGVGMDVVRKTIQSIGGRISIQSEKGKGTNFILTLPLTLAVLDGMLIAVGEECFIIPLINIIETIRPTPEQVLSLIDKKDILHLRNEIIPVIYLYKIFGIKNSIQEISKAIVVIVETDGGERLGIVVDEMIGQQQAVIKSLETNYASIDGISGATILGNGRVSFILDVSGLKHSSKSIKNMNVKISNSNKEEVEHHAGT